MKFFLKKVLQLSTICALGFGSIKIYQIVNQQNSNRPIAKTEQFVEKPFVVLILGHQNNPFEEKSIVSAISQNYQNFRILYISHSTPSQNVIRVQQNFGLDRFSIFEKADDQVSFESMHEAVKNCLDEEIIVLLDGKDFISHENVLTKLNKIYSTSPTWLTYGNYLDYPSYKQRKHIGKAIPKRVIFNNSYRKLDMDLNYFHTFYAGLFKKIRKEDICYKGGYIPVSTPLAVTIPMFEMSGKHSRFISEIMYLRNKTLDEELDIVEHLKKLPKYKRIKNLSFETN
jgi:hypothetical protein